MDNTKIKTIIKDIEKEYNFSEYIYNYMDAERVEGLEDSDELREYLNEINEDKEITEIEIIYYDKAMEYLTKNDTSLQESIALAVEMGCSLGNINSELLASLLCSDENLTDYENFINEVIERVENE